MKIPGARVVVTGASTGIGRDTALTLARKGAQVWGFARDGKRLSELDGVTPIVGDVSRAEDRQRIVDEVGRIDCLVNNAGLGFEGLIMSMTADDVRALYEINVLGLIDLTMRVLPQMLERGSGHIVNVGSIAGWASGPPQSVYASTKFAVAGFTDALRREVGHRGVGVTLIAPGPIKTEFVARCQTGGPAAEPGALDKGLPPSAVTKAILKGLQRSAFPGYSVITVPRLAGFTRLGSLPGVSRVADRVVRAEVQRLDRADA